MAVGPADESAQTDVDAGADEDGRGDDAEVLHDEIENVVGILARAQGAEDVADGFEHAGEGEGEEVVGAVSERLDEVERGGQGEEDDGEDAEGEGGHVAVDDDGGVVWALGVGEAGVDVAACFWCGAGHAGGGKCQAFIFSRSPDGR